MNEKYELIETDFKVTVLGFKVFRIKAKAKFYNVNVGDLGGYVEREENLDVSGDAWVSGDAQVSGNAWVYGNAQVHGNAHVHGNAQVHGNAKVYGNAWVYGNSQVHGDAWVYGNAQVHGNAWVSGDAHVHGNAQVHGNAKVYGDAWVYGDAKVEINPIVLINYCKWNITKTETHLHVGCKVMKLGDWIKWLDGKEEFETTRGTEEFKKIEKAIRFLCKEG